MVEFPGTFNSIGSLAVAIALLSVGIYVVTGAWPSSLGLWGALLFAVFGLAFFGTSRLAARAGSND